MRVGPPDGQAQRDPHLPGAAEELSGYRTKALRSSDFPASVSDNPTRASAPGRGRTMVVILAPSDRTWTAEAVEEVVLQLLGRLLHEDPDELRLRLLVQGASMPIDSLDLFDVLQEFRDATGLRIPVRELGHQTMKSVSAFSRFVADRGVK
jgi:acyl carrier protein